ncbi:MAG: AbrB family transcriptional regulator [Bacillota bacterium]|nr:AbrB family transcriptional regulator [Bacillota bacterium]
MIQDLLLLFMLGFAGWGLFKILHLPVPAMLGPLVLIGSLRALNYPLPSPPPSLHYFFQIVLGFSIGSRVNRETIRQLKELLKPALIIVTWAITIVFVFGNILSKITFMDTYTAILSSSMGGLPEMTVIALATNADVPVVVLMQTFRMLSTVVAFPLMLKFWFGDNVPLKKILAQNEKKKKRMGGRVGKTLELNAFIKTKVKQILVLLTGHGYFSRQGMKDGLPYLAKGLTALTLAAGGGFLLHYLGIPSGAMVGSTLATVALCLLRFPVRTPSPKIFELVIIGVGIVVSDNISPATIKVLFSGSILLPVVLSTIVIFLTSLMVAWIISRTAGWDYPTSFLAAAPGGFTLMIALAISSGKDPFKVSMLHLCRLLSLKIVIPLFFWFLV